jgi:glycyl-tRNA synthetase beta subunit
MHSAWFKGQRSAKAKEERRKELLSYKNAFDELKLILEQIKRKDPVRDYGPGWAEKQIAVNEYNAALDEVTKLIEFDKEK